jgi:hypothetical protein
MSNEEISQFVKSHEDFMKHAEVEESNFHQRSEYEQYRKESKVIIENEIEKEASRLEITVDYYLEEFM